MKTAKPRYAIYCKKPVLTQFNESEKMKKKQLCLHIAKINESNLF